MHFGGGDRSRRTALKYNAPPTPANCRLWTLLGRDCSSRARRCRPSAKRCVMRAWRQSYRGTAGAGYELGSSLTACCHQTLAAVSPLAGPVEISWCTCAHKPQSQGHTKISWQAHVVSGVAKARPARRSAMGIWQGGVVAVSCRTNTAEFEKCSAAASGVALRFGCWRQRQHAKASVRRGSAGRGRLAQQAI
jgi:hypothetical protein